MSSFMTFVILLQFALLSVLQAEITTSGRNNTSHEQIPSDDQNQYTDTTPHTHNIENNLEDDKMNVRIDYNVLDEMCTTDESQCTLHLTKCNNDYNAQNETFIQLNKTKNVMQHHLLLLEQNNTKMNNDVIKCKNLYDELLSHYRTSQTSLKDLQGKNNKLAIDNQKLIEANDRYSHGQFDTKIEALNNYTTKLEFTIEEKEAKMQQQAQEIKELIKQNGKYEQIHEHDAQTIHTLEQNNNDKQNTINNQSAKINQLTNDNRNYNKTHQIDKEKIKTTMKDNKQLKKQINKLINGFSLHENSNLKKNVNKLNKSLIQTGISLRDSQLKVGELSHELGECNVEWGSCEQKYGQCETATKVLQGDIQQQKHKFIMCNNVTKDCKNVKKELKDDLKSRKRDLHNCTNRLHNTIETILKDKCFITKEYKNYVYLVIGLFVFGIVMCGVIIYIFRKDKNDLFDVSQKIQKELIQERDELIQERDDLIEKNMKKDTQILEKDEQMKQFALWKIEMQRKQRDSVKIKPSDSDEEDIDDVKKGKKNETTDSNGSWSEVNEVPKSNDNNKKSNK